MDLEKYYEQASDLIVLYGTKLIGAIVIWIIGVFIIKILNKGITRLLDKRNIDASLKPFVISIVGTMLKIMLAITVLGFLGIEMTSFVALIGAAGLAVGMALSGTLQNFAGGVMILILKPFKNGDLLEAQGYTGVVKEIQVFNTILTTLDNKTIIIPNGGLSTSSMINYSTQPKRRVDWSFGIGYGDKTKDAKEVLLRLMSEDSRIISDPAAPFVAVSELGDSSVNFAVRAWVNAPDYWGVFFDMNEKVYNEFNKEGLNIPYPQMDVHVHKD